MTMRRGHKVAFYLPRYEKHFTALCMELTYFKTTYRNYNRSTYVQMCACMWACCTRAIVHHLKFRVLNDFVCVIGT